MGVTASGYSPSLTAVLARLTTLETPVAAQNPLAAGVANGVVNGVATLSLAGTVIQLPLKKSAFLQGAEAIVPNASDLLDNATAQSPTVPRSSTTNSTRI